MTNAPSTANIFNLSKNSDKPKLTAVKIINVITNQSVESQISIIFCLRQLPAQPGVMHAK